MRTRLTRARAALARRCGQRDTEQGRAIVEFVFLGVLLLVPLIYIVLTVARLQAASFALTNATREAGRVFIASETSDQARARADAAARLAMADFGFESGESLAYTCSADPCLSPQGRVQVDARMEVALPLIPDVFSSVVPTTITLTATQVVTVERFGGRPGVSP